MVQEVLYSVSKKTLGFKKMLTNFFNLQVANSGKIAKE
jgi:hypothetical protein